MEKKKMVCAALFKFCCAGKVEFKNSAFILHVHEMKCSDVTLSFASKEHFIWLSPHAFKGYEYACGYLIILPTWTHGVLSLPSFKWTSIKCESDLPSFKWKSIICESEGIHSLSYGSADELFASITMVLLTYVLLQEPLRLSLYWHRVKLAAGTLQLKHIYNT